MSWRIVAFVAGARRIGLPSSSKPSRTCSFPNSGRIDSTVASRSSSPASTSCSAVVVATALVIDALRNMVSGPAAPADPSYSTPPLPTT